MILNRLKLSFYEIINYKISSKPYDQFRENEIPRSTFTENVSSVSSSNASKSNPQTENTKKKKKSFSLFSDASEEMLHVAYIEHTILHQNIYLVNIFIKRILVIKNLIQKLKPP